MWPEWVKHVMEQSGANQAKPATPSPWWTKGQQWNADSTNAVINSPYTDSVTAITGKPARMESMQVPDKAGVLGMMINSSMEKLPWIGNQTDANGKTVRVNADKLSNRDEVKNTIAHELGHVMDDWNMIGHRDGWYKAVGDRKPKEGTYATTNSTEWYAESFAKAMMFVRGADQLLHQGYKMNPDELRHALGVVDNDIPGTAYMADQIISKPPFRDTLLGHYLMGDVQMKPVVVNK